MKRAFSYLFLCIFFVCMVTDIIGAVAITDYYNEVLRFDEEGNLVMTSYDGKASYSTTYRTLGWTIKRYNLPINDPNNTCVSIALENAGSRTDPENPEYIYSYFYADRDLIFQRIGEVSPEWQQELYQNGAIVYLDGIMTVCERGIPQGKLLNNGSASKGEVYYDYTGIAGARGWGPISIQSLKTHFNKQVEFYPVKELLPPEESEENSELVYQYFHMNELGLEVDAEAVLKSQNFNVEDGIPTSEALYAEGEATRFAFRCAYRRIEGTKSYRVPVEIEYTLEWDDEEGGTNSATRTVRKNYQIKRSYSYWIIEEMRLYYPSKLKLNNNSLEGGSITIPIHEIPEVLLEASKKEEEHITDPVVRTLFIDGGSVYGGSSRPSVPNENFYDEADESIGEILVKNDFLKIDGQVILNNLEHMTTSPEPLQPQEPEHVKVREENLIIPYYKENGEYSSNASVYYTGIYFPEEGSGTLTKFIQNINPVIVHTPVICIGGVSDDKAKNQMVSPIADKASLILGEPFTVTLSTEGEHRDIKGYGEQDYRRYAWKTQVKFPFQVIYKEKEIKKDTWISIGKEAVFELPIEVQEGRYTIEYRTVAENAESDFERIERTQEFANMRIDNYVAVDEIEAVVMGRLFGFGITDIHDYPRWENVFHVPEAMENNTKGYYVGIMDFNGKPVKIHPIFTLPIMPGSNSVNQKSGAVKTGYHFSCQVQTIGDFYNDEDTILLKPTFYYINKETGNRFQADLYFSATVNQSYQNLIPWTGDIVLTKNDRSYVAENRSHQLWSFNYYLPQRIYAVPKGTTLPLYNINTENWLKNGYILINFQIWARNKIESEDKLYLSYCNQWNAWNGYCNMWRLEGFNYNRKDIDGIDYSLIDGDSIVYDLDHSLIEDYKTQGTH